MHFLRGSMPAAQTLLNPRLERDVVPVLDQPVARLRFPGWIVAQWVTLGTQRAQELPTNWRAACDQRWVLLEVVSGSQPAIVVANVEDLADLRRHIRRDAMPHLRTPQERRIRR